MTALEDGNRRAPLGNSFFRTHVDDQELTSLPLTGLILTCPMVMTRNTVPDRYTENYLGKDQNAKAPVITAESRDFIMCEYTHRDLMDMDRRLTFYAQPCTKPTQQPAFFSMLNSRKGI
jgi:hypothetical protein